MISIVIPFRSQDNDRDVLLDYVVERYSGFWPDAEIIVSDCEGERFNRSAARNRGVEASSGDTLIIADADTITDKKNLEVGTSIVGTTNRWVLPYNDRGYWNLNHDFTRYVLNHDPLADVSYRDTEFGWNHRIESWAGILIMPREAFDAVNGYDERFKGWGYEDNAFRLALDVLWGSYLRTDGDVYHLYHAVAEGTTFDSPDIDYNRTRFYERYQRIAARRSRREEMQELVKGNR